MKRHLPNLSTINLFNTIVAILSIIIPFIISYVFESSEVSLEGFELTHHLHESTALLIVHTSCIAAVIPLGIDVIFDIWGNVSNNSTVSDNSLCVRFLYGLALAIPSTIFLCFKNSKNIGLIYVALIHSRNAGIGSILFFAVHKELKLKSEVFLPQLMFVAMSLLLAYSVTIFYGIWFNWSESLQHGFFFVQLASFFCMLSTFVMWYRISSQRNRERHIDSWSMDEYTCIAYFVPTLVVGILTPLCSITNNDYTWPNRNEPTLVFLMSLHFCFVVAVTMIPGRIIRLLAMSKINSLSLKQVFVRYVSHEIRSPLHVVLAGLELLRSNSCSELTFTFMDLIVDMQSAAETAISILNDLLQYENMDAGTLKLDLSWKPLKRLLQGKLNWASILAAKKNVNLPSPTLPLPLSLVRKLTTIQAALIQIFQKMKKI